MLGDYRYTVEFAHAVAAQGKTPIVAHDVAAEFSARSRLDIHCERVTIDTLEGFRADLLAVLDTFPDCEAIIPLGDAQALLLSKCKEALPNGVDAITSGAETISKCADKLAMCRLAEAIGIPQAPFRSASAYQEIVEAAHEVGFPCVVKPCQPLESDTGLKALIARSPRDLEVLGTMSGESMIVQRYVEGLRYNVQLVAYEGRLVDRLVTLTLRTNRGDGTGYTVESRTVRPSQVMDRYTALILQELGFSGLACLQFLGREGSHELSFLEINPRLGAAWGVARSSGVDLAARALETWDREALGEKQEGLSDYRPGRRMVWTTGDLDGLRGALAAGEIGHAQAGRWLVQAIVAFLRADHHTTFKLTDPWPAVGHLWERAWGVKRRLLSSSI